MNGTYLEPGEELPFQKLGCVVETGSLILDIMFQTMLSSYQLCDLGQLTSLWAVPPHFHWQSR